MIPYAATPGFGNLRRLPIALALIFAFTLTASAQQAAPTDNWTKVQALTTGTSIRVNTAKLHTRCTLKSETMDALTCVQGKVDVTFPRADIQTIKVGRRVRSAAIGAIPGGIVMAGAGIALATENCTGQLLCGLGAAALLLVGGLVTIIGAGIGAFTDFAGPTISLRP